MVPYRRALAVLLVATSVAAVPTTRSPASHDAAHGVPVAPASAGSPFRTIGPSTASGAASPPADADLPAPAERPVAPEFAGLDGWLNGPPLSMRALRGSVVLVDFWTYDRINCIDTIPGLRRLSAEYGPRGLVIVGVQTPEFEYERVPANVAAAARRLGVVWPIALDGRMATWGAWDNRYWPAQHLVERQGRVAWSHIGEGDDDTIASRVAELLAGG